MYCLQGANCSMHCLDAPKQIQMHLLCTVSVLSRTTALLSPRGNSPTTYLQMLFPIFKRHRVKNLQNFFFIGDLLPGFYLCLHCLPMKPANLVLVNPSRIGMAECIATKSRQFNLTIASHLNNALECTG